MHSTVDLFHRDALVAEITRLRIMYEPHPTPWFGQAPDQQEITTEQWVAVITEAGVTAAEFTAAALQWAASDKGDKFPAPLDLIRLVSQANRLDAARHSIPADRVHCDGSGWRRTADDDLIPCGRCSPALALVFADPVKLARWREGTSLADLDVGVEMRRGVLRYLIPLALEHPCARDEHDYYAKTARGLEMARRGYAEECEAQGRAPSWPHFDGMLARAAARAMREAPADAPATVE